MPEMHSRRQITGLDEVRAFWNGFGQRDKHELQRINQLATASLTYQKIRSMMAGMRDARVLDVGCGWGRMLKRFHADGFQNIYGVELSESLLEHCREFMPDAQVSQADFHHLPFDSATFSVSYCVRVLHYSPNLHGAVKEIARVTMQGGSIIVIQPNAGNPWRRWRYDMKTLSVENVIEAFRASGLTEIRYEYFGFTSPGIYIPGAELLARMPSIRTLAAFFAVAGRVPAH